MNKTELIEKIAANAEVSKAVAKKALDATTEAIKEALAAKIAAKKVAKFKAGAELADAVNK